jgi:carboxymethylenebutenolidase
MVELDVPYYLAQPKQTPANAGVVVIHEGNGMSLQLLRFVERLAAEGFAVAAPDLFFRTGGPAASADYRDQVGALRKDEVLDDVAVTGSALRALGARHIGVTGFCMGGTFTWQAARYGSGYEAAVGFYGSGIASDLGPLGCPTLLFFGGSDPWIPSGDISRVAAHHPDTIVYPEAGHGFMRDGSDDYVPAAASDAWSRLLTHFRQHLAWADRDQRP